MTIFANDRDLLDRFRRGERPALAAVFEHYVDEVATLARRGFTIESSGHVYVRGATRDGEYELVQETFAKAFAGKARIAYDGLSPYRPYLLRITKNLMIDRYRAEQKEARTFERDALDLDAFQPAAEAPPDLHWQQLSTATAEYVATLGPEPRELVRLRFEEGTSQERVAEALGWTRRKVRTLERDLQQGLRSWLKQRGFLDR
ncbi:MAG: RNA polymerase sigma factor [Kofleriaceae bacterium]